MEETALYLFFAKLGPSWVNATTVVSAVFGIVFSFFAFFYSKKSSDRSNLLIAEIEKTSALAHQNARILRLDNLRVLYDLSDGTDSHLYWRFRWRFETFDCLRIHLYEKKDDQKIFLGYCEILIEGFSNPSNYAGFERKDSEFYKVKIRDIQKETNEKFPFQLNEFAACFCGNSEMQISKGIDPRTEHPKFCFELGGLGHMKFSHGDPVIDDMGTHTRIKDT